MPEELAPNPPLYDPARGEEIRSVLDRYGESLRGQKRRTGIDHMTMKEMVDGNRVRLEKVEAFATGFDLDVNYWRERFGYPRVEERNPERMAGRLAEQVQESPEAREAVRKLLDQVGLPGPSGAQILDAGLYQLSQRTGEVIPYNGATPRGQLTPEQARKELADIEAELRELGRLKD